MSDRIAKLYTNFTNADRRLSESGESNKGTQLSGLLARRTPMQAKNTKASEVEKVRNLVHEIRKIGGRA